MSTNGLYRSVAPGRGLAEINLGANGIPGAAAEQG